MKEEEILKNKSLVDKYLNKKKYLCLFDAYFYNIDDLSIYIRLDYNNKNATYHINWVNLSSMDDKNVEFWINSTLLFPSMVDKIKNIIAKNGMVENYQDNDGINSKVIINSYLKEYEYNIKTFKFNRYIPNCWQFLADLLFIVFENMPRYIYPLFQIIIEKIIKPDTNCVFNFDFNNDNFDELFDKETIKIGKEYYKDSRIIFLEKETDFYKSVVCGSQNYLVSILIKDNTKEVQMSCNCPHDGFCKHIYATLLAIKNKEEYRYFKIAHVDDDKDLIDNLKNFNYLLCVGIVDDYFVVIDNFDFVYVPILKDGKLNFKIIEDDDKKTLEKQLNKYLKKHQK